MSPKVMVKMNLRCFGTFLTKIEYPSTINKVVLQEITKPITITKKLWNNRKDSQDEINSVSATKCNIWNWKDIVIPKHQKKNINYAKISCIFIIITMFVLSNLLEKETLQWRMKKQCWQFMKLNCANISVQLKTN
jgi:hypothetical protein